jgi:NADH:ubiquinone oxidoreductase subunit
MSKVKEEGKVKRKYDEYANIYFESRIKRRRTRTRRKEIFACVELNI